MIKIDGVKVDYDLAKYPARYREVEVFLDLANKNPGHDVQHIDDTTGEIIGWRNDEVRSTNNA